MQVTIPAPANARITHRIPSVIEMTGASRSTIYQALRRGELEAVKVGRATLVLDESLRRWIANLPRYADQAA